MATIHTWRCVRLLEDIDSNSDGKISFEEFEKFFDNKALLKDLEARARTQKVEEAPPSVHTKPDPSKVRELLALTGSSVIACSEPLPQHVE